MKNWKTTFTGIIGAIIIAILPYLERGSFKPRDLLPPVVIAVLGFLTKDYDTTGAGKDAKKEK
jgi:uncharacterized membrane protein